MASSRKTRPLEAGIPSATDTAQLTNNLRMQLKAYSQYAVAVNATLRDLNQIQSELDIDMKPINLVKGRLERSYDQIGDQTAEELKRLDAAIDTLDILARLPQPAATTSAPSGSATPTVGTPTATGHKRGPYKKRAKTDAASTAGSPTNSTAPSPMQSRANSPVHNSGGGASSVPGASSGIARAKAIQPAPSPASTGSPAPKGMKGSTAKSKKEAIAAQLPLQVGRQVAFRLPSKAGDGKKDEWILANVKSSTDKNKYIVEDSDPDPSAPEAGKYNTTLKNIIPLPDRRLPNSYPEHDFAPGLAVLALYPDTTSFYRATIVSGPHSLNVGTAVKKKDKDKDKTYKLKFEDDDDRTCEVLQESIVEQP